MALSDDERDRTVKALTRHCGDGRITLDELEERIELAFAAQTRAELIELTRDLPSDEQLLGAPRFAERTPVLRDPVRTPVMHTVEHGSEVALKIHAVVFLAVMGLLIAIWILTTPFGYPWPIWVAIPWGAGLAIHAGVHKAVSAANGTRAR